MYWHSTFKVVKGDYQLILYENKKLSLYEEGGVK